MWQSLSKGHFSPQLVFPIGKLEQDKCVWNDYSLYVMSTVSNSVEQCRTVSTVSTVSTVIARCYLHLRWYFFISTDQLFLAMTWCLYLCRLRFCLFVFAWGFVECVCGHICSEREIELVINGSSSGGGHQDHFGPQYLNPNLQEQIVRGWCKGH